MSSDRYQNCFYYYRGHAPGLKESDRMELRERQFEDNTTKALINVLEHGDMAASFVAEVVGHRTLATDSKNEYFLQGGPDKTALGQTILIGISTLGEIDPDSWRKDEQPESGRVDASFLSPSGDLFLIETKVVEYLDGPQLDRHAKDWGIATTDGPPRTIPARWSLVSWAEVYRWAEGQAAGSQPGSVGGFLADQFREYLELTGLAPFSGFRREHFDYFRLTREQRLAGEQSDVAEQIKARLDGIWGVIKDLAPDTYAQLGEIRVGRLKAQYEAAFAETHSGTGKPNLTLEIGAEDLQLNLVGWTGGQVYRLERWLRSEAGSVTLGELGAHELIVQKRTAKKDKNGAPFWMGAPGRIIDRLPAQEAADDLSHRIDGWTNSLDPTWERIAFHIRRSWLPTEVAGVGSAFIPDLIGEIERLLPIVDQTR